MIEYHFSLGNSSTGPVGYCAVVKAASKQQALETLKQFVGNSCIEVEVPVAGDLRMGYLQIYLNPDTITVADIDMVEDIPAQG